ncbi:UDP-3-O-(3-hydroxymyristoyl)glucosamine N-acyltransferase [Bacterioplanoides sp.]|uniref:UDP-3-O-(3-hydroxymyristoyl)glucosamine N-acyltransferase n=1 Tax=Bacterioplanoides sp. TaxID=2066072 RepID=UPI003AFFC276
MKITLGELATRLGLTLVGDQDTLVTGLNTLKEAQAGEVSFLANASYQSQLADSQASAVIVSEAQAELVVGSALISANPYLSFAQASQLFNNRPAFAAGVHETAVVADTAVIAEGVSVGANAVIGEHCQIGAGSEIGASTVVSDHCVVGENCQLNPNVTLYHNVVLGDRVIIHSGAVIGADGFGFAPDQGKWHKICQLGGVRIGNDVEIGANTTVDRGALDDTVIEDDVIIDNLVQIAHNVRVGRGSAIAGCAGIAGSTTVGQYCTVAGGAGLAGHLNITDGVHIGPMALISKSITEKGAYGSGTAQMPMKEWRRSATRFRQLDSMAKRLQQLEKIQKGEV